MAPTGLSFHPPETLFPFDMSDSENKPLSVGPLNTGSLLRSSEGVTLSGMLALVTTMCTGQDADPEVAKWAILGLGIAVGCYAISRGMAKRSA